MTKFGFLSTYPPTRCGLATFTESLAAAMVGPNDPDASIIRVLDVPVGRPPALVGARSVITADLIAGDSASFIAAIDAMNNCDVAIVQHEYGIYGGRDGDEVVEVLKRVETPCIVVLHTVLASPSEHQRQVLNEVCELAVAVVVMTEKAREILLTTYEVAQAKVSVIPHGVPIWATDSSRRRQDRRRILTWGLISPGKGIEWGIRAVAGLADLTPAVHYIVAGQTHPKVLAYAGESYREMLSALVDDLGLNDSVTLDGRYLDAPQLADLVGGADVVLLPYDSRDQVTSGVLVEAIAAGVPIVATGFPHAVELLAGGAGIVAAHEDPTSIANALRTVLTVSGVAERMHLAALREAQETSWPAVASQYRALAERLVPARAA